MNEEPSTEPSKNPADATTLADDMRLATAFLTRLPLALSGAPKTDALARSMVLFPIVGALIGLFAGAVAAAALWLGVPAPLAALLAVLAQVAVTGALHEDGLADFADGIGGGRDAEAKLSIMRDSRLGSYGALALIVAVLARTLAVAALLDARHGIVGPAFAAAALVAAGSTSRAVLPVIIQAQRSARRIGLAATAGRPGRWRAAISAGLAITLTVAAVAAAGAAVGDVAGALVSAAVALALAAAAAGVAARLARVQVGGYTGDTLGACQQITEIVMLIAFAAR